MSLFSEQTCSRIADEQLGIAAHVLLGGSSVAGQDPHPAQQDRSGRHGRAVLAVPAFRQDLTKSGHIANHKVAESA
jgi:hypothetical protein